MVELEHAAESLTAFDSASDRVSITHWLNQLIAKSLMVPFGMVILDVFTLLTTTTFGTFVCE